MEHIINLWRPILEIGFIWLFIYFTIRIFQGTRALQVLIGLAFFAIVFNLSKWLELNTISWFLNKLAAVGFISFIILFQPELRRALARVGQNTFFSPFLKKGGTVDEIVEACNRMSKIRRGALIAIEREMSLQQYLESGIPLDAKVSAELLITIFAPNAPIHDGAVIIQGDRIAGSGALFPLSQNLSLARTLGTRHRAAIGITEETDAVCIVASEETGSISVSVYGKLTGDLDEDGLRRVLKSLFRPDENRNKFLEFLQNKIRLVPKAERSQSDL